MDENHVDRPADRRTGNLAAKFRSDFKTRMKVFTNQMTDKIG